MTMTSQTEDIWQRMKIGWHIAFGVFVVLAAVLVGTDPSVPVRSRAAILIMLALLCCAYAVLGVRLVHAEQQPKGLVYVAVAGVLILGMFTLAPATGVLLFIFYPQLWAVLPTRLAIAATVVMVLAVGMITVFVTTGGWGFTTVIILTGLAVALVLGLWVSKIMEQSTARARLAAELAATRSELAEVSRQAGILAERERLARDLHDTLAQGENSVLMLVRAARTALSRDPADCARHLDLAEQATSDNLREIRALVGALTPAALDGITLPAAVRRLAERISAESGITVSVDTDGAHRNLPASIEVPLFRAAQEALANVRKHSGAGTVRVGLRYQPDLVTLRVVDDGRGFEPDNVGGFGLVGLRARVSEAGGDVSVDTAPGAGVALTASLPIGAC